jgi:hypothetical protein
MPGAGKLIPTRGAIDLDSIEGVDRAMDLAASAGASHAFHDLAKLRKRMLRKASGRAGATMAGDLAQIRSLIREDIPAAPGTRLRRIQDIARACRKLSSDLDRAGITSVLTCGGRRSQPKRGVCCGCGYTLAWDDECDYCLADMRPLRRRDESRGREARTSARPLREVPLEDRQPARE